MSAQKKYLGLYQGFNPGGFDSMSGLAILVAIGLAAALLLLFLR